MPITAIFASLLALLFIVLSVRTLTLRKKLQIGIGDGNDKSLLRAIRVHGNFAEYTPLGLILLGLLESLDPLSGLVIGFGLCLLIGRCVHAFGVSQVKENFKFRVTGMALTFTCLAGCSLTILSLTVINQL